MRFSSIVPVVCRRFLPIGAVWGVLALSVTGALGQSASNMITFDAPGAGTGYGDGTTVSGMNSQGVIVGTVSDSAHRASGFLRHADGSMSIIRVPGAKDTHIYGINDSGTIVGSFDSQGFKTTYGFVRTPDGKFTYFLPVGTQFLNWMSIDSVGNVAGTITSTYDFFVCYIRTADGTITTFTPPAGFGCQTNDIAAGTVSGTYGAPTGFSSAFLRHPDGTFTDFLVGYQTDGAMINSAETTAGPFVLSDGSSHGYLRASNGAITYFDLAGATTMGVADINSGGSVTGSYTNSSDSANHGFQRLPDGTIETFDVPGAGTGQFQGTSPVKINDSGSIAGGFSDSSNVYHGFLLTP